VIVRGQGGKGGVIEWREGEWRVRRSKEQIEGGKEKEERKKQRKTSAIESSRTAQYHGLSRLSDNPFSPSYRHQTVQPRPGATQ
jgi:hypothetical protein